MWKFLKIVIIKINNFNHANIHKSIYGMNNKFMQKIQNILNE